MRNSPSPNLKPKPSPKPRVAVRTAVNGEAPMASVRSPPPPTVQSSDVKVETQLTFWGCFFLRKFEAMFSLA